MTDLAQIAPAFVEMAHQIVWCSAATVDASGRPRSRILHPYWEWDGTTLVGWIATGPTPVKKAALDRNPAMSLNYWTPTHDTCTADCATEWLPADEDRIRVWDLFKNGPAPVGYDPAIIPPWKDGPLSEGFVPLRLDPYRLRVFPGTVLLGQGGTVLTWHR
jgi:hypothetical protein